MVENTGINKYQSEEKEQKQSKILQQWYKMQNEVYKVTSEIYNEYDYLCTKKPLINKDNVVSAFRFRYPPKPPARDPDGDLIVSRKSENLDGVIEIEHSQRTVLDLVGLQIWRGALLLADWLLHNGESLSKDEIILELGSGVGLTSIVASMFAPVFCTDVNKCDILKLIESNTKRNKNICKYPITVLELDFLDSKLPTLIEENLSKISLILAADVVYDDMITREFVKTIERLLTHTPSNKRMIYVALEKRYVFTIADCDSVAPCFEYFVECLNATDRIKYEQIPLDFPQYYQYDRVKELVLFKISLVN